jgi:hypothetical protein
MLYEKALPTFPLAVVALVTAGAQPLPESRPTDSTTQKKRMIVNAKKESLAKCRPPRLSRGFSR